MSLKSRFKKTFTAPIKAATKLTKVATKPLVSLKGNLSNPKSLLDPKAIFKQEFRTGKEMGRALEATVVSLNPLDHTLEKFGKAGIKAGGIGKFLGRTSEKARKNPVAIAVIALATYFTAGYASSLFSGGGAAAGGAAAEVGAAGAVATETVAAGSGILGTSVTAAEVSTYAGYAGTALKAGQKVMTTLNAPKEAAAQREQEAAAQREQEAELRAAYARQQGGGFFAQFFRAIFG